MPDEPKLTMNKGGLALTIAVIGLGIYDLIAVLVNGVGSSVSNFLVGHGFHAPLMVFAFGFVAGHLFGDMRLKTEGEK